MLGGGGAAGSQRRGSHPAEALRRPPRRQVELTVASARAVDRGAEQWRQGGQARERLDQDGRPPVDRRRLEQGGASAHVDALPGGSAGSRSRGGSGRIRDPLDLTIHRHARRRGSGSCGRRSLWRGCGPHHRILQQRAPRRPGLRSWWVCAVWRWSVCMCMWCQGPASESGGSGRLAAPGPTRLMGRRRYRRRRVSELRGLKATLQRSKQCSASP